MTYTIEISDTDPKSKSIIEMFKMLALDYDFLKIVKSDDNLDFMTDFQKEDFEKRYNYTVQNPNEGKTWEEIEAKYFKK